MRMTTTPLNITSCKMHIEPSEEDKYSNQQKSWIYNNGCVNCSTSKYNDQKLSKKSIWFITNLKTKTKGNLTEDGCASIIVEAIGNVFIKLLWTDRKTNLVGFYEDLFNKSITIGSNTTIIDLPNVTIIYQTNKTTILHGGSNSIISTANNHDFCVSAYNVSNNHGRKHKINARYQVIPVKL